MKNLMICILALAGYAVKGQTQGMPPAVLKGNAQQDATEAADRLCECINLQFADINPAIVKMIDLMATEGEEVSIQFLTDFLSQNPDEMESISFSLEKMKILEVEAEFEALCGLAPYSIYDQNEPFNLLFNELISKKESCDLARKLMAIGATED